MLAQVSVAHLLLPKPKPENAPFRACPSSLSILSKHFPGDFSLCTQLPPPPLPLPLPLLTPQPPFSFPFSKTTTTTTRKEEEEAEDLQELEEEEEEEDPDDPILRFFKSRSSTQDPQREGKLSLQKNRRSSWRLADDTQLVDESETDSGIEGVLEQQKEQTRPLNFDSRALSEEIVEEILQKARTLPQNLTLGEVLGVLKEGLETSLVTPRACSVLFPMLGRAGMGDKLMILFRNLPAKKEFRDVHVYNAAISGLMCSKRYDDAWEVYEAMEANNTLPDHVTCSIMITVMRKVGRSAKDSWQFFERMNRKGVKWSQEVLGALIKSSVMRG
ncbi:pentatricopeptide repeat-containing protein [Prunus yedoensis var. nudiflora]|uniref:Pentatricopeptide repeat-containing protein n=1 Tax=Prunus yedoensis var. nudiflora TaxID=2094558 RepID=A0A314ZK06_PRUYE|nr:pentatricopeptide repeat-containing protein [Prunus yedoensis var. nudiflora]